MLSKYVGHLFLFCYTVSSTDENFCRGKRNGLYSTGACTTSYIECLGNSTFVRPCPPDLWYRQEAERCDAKDLNPYCTHSLSVCDKDYRKLNVKNYCELKGTGSFKYRPGDSTLGTHDGPVRCSKEKELSFKLKVPGRCTEIYWQCVHGRPLMMSCPFGLRFDVTKSACDHEGLVADCRKIDDIYIKNRIVRYTELEDAFNEESEHSTRYDALFWKTFVLFKSLLANNKPEQK
ncbi:unnamed protein product [Bursaphelenchus okinawaensis]|uniref:Chitin-binding type-2 domain-containing protein n=1 Tax=Bursaphelenchus okinawaensis TaxID=465554 RepID=A0A811KBX1_9BILA|nr:unnamed protein product [Bursaphelenchus okinawaensis]CAG9095874.1 unnamed protein product [Bursaphelenchus okinawaensis]